MSKIGTESDVYGRTGELRISVTNSTALIKTSTALLIDTSCKGIALVKL